MLHAMLFNIVGVLTVVVFYAAILRRWRWGVYGMIAFFPFVGLPTLLLYPAPGWTRLLKDFLFIIPAYGSFLLVVLTRPASLRPGFRGAPTIWLVLLAALGTAHLLNPNLINLLV